MWVSNDEVIQSDFDLLVEDLGLAGKSVDILTGTHGTPMGGLEIARQFYVADLIVWGDRANFFVWDVPQLTDADFKTLINSPNSVVCAFCFADRNRSVIRALGGKALND